MSKREGPSTWRGHPLFDGKKPVQFHVTQADVKSASLKNHFQCAAAKRLVADGYEEACVSLSVAYVVKGGKAYRYKVPSSLRTEIVSFDRGGGFTTGTYTLAPPAESHRIGRGRTGGPDTGRGHHDKGSKNRTSPNPRTQIIIGSNESGSMMVPKRAYHRTEGTRENCAFRR